MSASSMTHTGKRFGRRSRQAMAFVLALLLALPALAGGKIAHAASDTSSWILVDDGELAKDTSKSFYHTNLIEYNGELYVLWSEAGGFGSQMHAMKYNGSGWDSVDELQTGCIPAGCLNTYADEIRVGNLADSPSLAVYNDKLYAAWYERYGAINNQIRVRQFDGTNWTTADGGSLNLTEESAVDPQVTVYNGELYGIWSENNQIQVKRYDEAGAEWQVVSPAASLSENLAAFSQLAVYDGSLYAVWREATGAAGEDKIKVSRYAGDTSWESIDGGGLSSDGGASILHPSVAVFGDKMYVAWSDKGQAIRVMSYDEENGWQWADDNAALNYNAGSSVYVPKLIAYDGNLYAAWVEGSSIRAKRYDGSSWTTADSDHELNARIGSYANYPSLAIYNNKLFAAWTESYDSKNRVRVAQMPVLQAPDAPQNAAAAAGDGEATVSFDPPASNGGSPITEYTVTSNPGGLTATGSASPIQVTGLTNGESYTFTVTAKNALGTSDESVPSNSVKPKAGFKILVSGGLSSPMGLAADGSGQLYITDSAEAQVVQYGADGSLLSTWKHFGPDSADSFGSPSGIAASASGSAYVADGTNGRVYIFDNSGSLTGVLGESGELLQPSGIALDKVGGKVYVADQASSQIKVFDADGSLADTWGDGTAGNGPGQFNHPSGIALDEGGNVYVADTDSNQIQKWNSDGQFVEAWGSLGSLDGQLNRPGGVAVDGDGNVYVADTFNHRIQKFDSDGGYLESWGTQGSGEGQFQYPYGVSVDDYGNVYAVDSVNHRIQILRNGPILPTITAQPSDTTAVNGGASFSVTATGTDLTYQWQVYSALSDSFANVPGETNATLTLVNLLAFDNGAKYRVIVSGSGQTVTSAEATLTVEGAPANSANNSVVADSSTVTAGDPVALTAIGDRQTAEGAVVGDERYIPVSWVSTEGSNSGAFAWSAADNGYVASYLTAEAGSYVVTATFQKQKWTGSEWENIADATSTSTVSVTVNAVSPGGDTAPTITAQPSDTTAVNGNASFSVTATGTDLTYQWQVYSALSDSFANVPGETNATLTLVNLSASDNGARYRVIVSGSGQTVTSAEATLTVSGPPEDPATPANSANNSVSADPAAVTAGDTVALTAIGDRQATEGAVVGDERYIPVSWASTEGSNSGTFAWSAADNGYVASYLTAEAGSYVVTATFQKQRWTGSEWEDIADATSTSTVSVTVNANPGGGSAPSTGTVSETEDSNADILVNGKVESAGKATTVTVNNRKVTTIAVDPTKLNERLAGEDDHAVVTIPVSGDSDAVIGELNGQMIKNMENRLAVLEIQTSRATYTVPAGLIDIDAISKQIGAAVALQDIKVRIEIAASAASTVQLAEDAAAQGDFTLAAPPVDFTITCAYGDTTVEIAKFNAYVDRAIAIPDGADPNRMTTGIAVDPDGTVRHVPTRITAMDGKYVAHISSLTNSTYAIVWHPLAYSDMAGHWAQDAVNDMGSRMVIEGIGGGLFGPDRDITRAEFAAIVVRGLGLRLDNGAMPFADVAASDWYAGAVNAAYEYGLIDGYEDGMFHPNDKITREQAMRIIAKAMATTGLKEKLPASSEDALLAGYADRSAVSGWARSGAADSVQAGIVTGRNGAKLAPKAYMTRAEVATVVSRLLKQSGLI